MDRRTNRLDGKMDESFQKLSNMTMESGRKIVGEFNYDKNQRHP